MNMSQVLVVFPLMFIEFLIDKSQSRSIQLILNI